MKTWKSKIISVFVVLVIAAVGYMAGSGTFTTQNISASPVLYSQDTVTSIYDAASPAVVEIDVIQTGTSFFGNSMTEAQGSGFLVDNQGHILTNNHVVEGASTVTVTLNNGNTINATVVGTDSINDLAVISVDTSAVSGITPLQFGDSSAVKPGQLAIAIGNPYGLDDTITVGVISGVNRTLSGSSMTGMLQTDAAINPGNSGGPLLDVNGSVIGINTAIESTATGARGIGFAVSSNVAQKDLPDLIAGNQVVRPWLGISGLALTQTTADTLGLSVNQGVYVVSVVSGSPAEAAGLKAGGTDTTGNPGQGGDVITAVDNTAVKNVQELSSYLNTKRVGDSVTLSVLRDGNTINIQVTLGTWPDNPGLNSTPDTIPTPQATPNPRMPRGRWYYNAP